MEPPDAFSVLLNESAEAAASLDAPVCAEWTEGAQDSVFQLSNVLLLLGFMGGSGFYGLLYTFTLLTLGFFCAAVWSWSDPCTTDGFLWSLALLAASGAQLMHVSYRLKSVTFDRDFQELYGCMFQRLGVSLSHFGEIVDCCEGEVRPVERDHCFAVEGKTPIDKLSVLLSGRMIVTVNGEFLHYIHPFQFLDSPEWDSLRPSEEGVFQVTLRAESRCRYVAWRRKKLYLLFAKHRYIAKVFALVVRHDISEKLFSLHDQALLDGAGGSGGGGGRRYDLRLPSCCHVHKPDLEPSDAAGPLLLLQVPAGCQEGVK